MKLLSYVFTVLGLASAVFAGPQCARDLQCLTTNAQMTIIGRVMSRDDTNPKLFAADVQPICTVYSTQGTITQDEYARTIRIGGFGSHAGGSCQAEIGNVGDVGIFFIHVNNTVTAGGIRNFGLYDPCYGAFVNNTDNYVNLAKFIHSKYPQYTPSGNQCPVITEDENHVYVDGNPYEKDVPLDMGNNGINLDDEGSGAMKNYYMTTTMVVALLLLLQLIF